MIRHLAHLAGWHTNACRGRIACSPVPGCRSTHRGWYTRRPKRDLGTSHAPPNLRGTAR